MRRWFPILSVVGAALLCFVSCGGSECATDDDCPTGRVCRLGLCALSAAGPDAGFGPDVSLDCRPATPDDFVLNEFLANPKGSDFHGDGTYDSGDDEFVELVNIASEPVGLLNVQLRVSDEPVNLTPVCVDAGSAHVHWGADDSLGLNNDGDTLQLLVDGEIIDSHTYGGEGGNQQSITRVVQLDPSSAWVGHGDISDRFWSPGTCPDGGSFPDCVPGSSGGTDAVGTVDLVDTAAPCDAAAPEPGQLIIHEVLADPGSKHIDANQDGWGDNKDDEFVEIVNISGVALALGGVSIIVDSDAEDYFTFPTGTCLSAGQAALVFDTYSGGGDFGGAIAFQTPNTNLGLNNNGDSVRLVGDGGDIDAVVYTKTEADYDQSMTRQVDLEPTAPMVRHSEVAGAGAACPPMLTEAHQPSSAQETPRYQFQCGAVATPGRCNSGAPFPDCLTEVGPDADAGDGMDGGHGDGLGGDGLGGDGLGGDGGPGDVPPSCGAGPAPGDLRINEIMSDPAGVDHNGDGGAQALEDEYVELVNVTGGPLDLASVELVTGGGTDSEVKRSLGIAGCLESQHGLLVFGGGSPALSIEGVMVITVDGSLSLNNGGGDSVALVGLGGVVLDQYVYEELSGESWVRYPAGSGEFMTHGAAAVEAEVVPPLPTEYSPGKCVDGSQLPFCL
ncbi:MAG: lamin tail domain-containing protein [Myxococcota bacterium]|nr:lamin tail domain-containing protein [Myxococcota bacterium]